MCTVIQKPFDWKSKHILVTGGASFIGSHLVDKLVTLGAAHIRIIDDLSTGKLQNIQSHIDAGRVEFIHSNLLDDGVARAAIIGMDVVFHLAAIHGGRGYIDLHQAQCAQNLILDGIVIREAHQADVEKFIFASSGCVYPTDLQSDVTKEVYLREDMVGPRYNADGMYGWAKLMTEMTLKAYYESYGFKSASCRFFTAYGERCLESHAIMAMIGRAFLEQVPFEIWGDGTQIRNWTYVSDIVEGLILAAEKIEDGTAINLGTEEPVRVLEAAELVLKMTRHNAEIKLRRDMPTGPLNRVASNDLAYKLLGWNAKYKFIDGLRKTVDWYFTTHQQDEVEQDFERKLIER
ncbi:TPA: NAD-dependent epimerase/dehydratase family protein [Bacillus cereus]